MPPSSLSRKAREVQLEIYPAIEYILNCLLYSIALTIHVIMSRAGTSSQRTLTLTEELERLEQSITLTLQGIPYARHSTVEDGSITGIQKSITISVALIQ